MSITAAQYYRENKEKAVVSLRQFHKRIASGRVKTWEEALTLSTKEFSQHPLHIVKKATQEEIKVPTVKITPQVYTSKQAFYDSCIEKGMDIQISYKTFCERTHKWMYSTWEEAILSGNKKPSPKTPERVTKNSTLSPLFRKDERTAVSQYNLYKKGEIVAFYKKFKSDNSVSLRSFRERITKQKNRNEDPLQFLEKKTTRDRFGGLEKLKGIEYAVKHPVLEGLDSYDRDDKLEQYYEKKKTAKKKDIILLCNSLNYDSGHCTIEGVYIVLDTFPEEGLLEVARWNNPEEMFIVESKFTKKIKR